MIRKAFFDSDVLIFAHNMKARYQPASQYRVSRAWDEHNGVVSTNVLQELFEGLVKLKIFAPGEIRQCVGDFLSWHVVVDDVFSLSDAMDDHVEKGTPLYAALAIQAAVTAGADVLYSYRISPSAEISGLSVERPKLD